MKEEQKICQFRQAHICCLPEGHGGGHYPVDVSSQWLAMLNSIRYKDEQIKRLLETLEKYEPTTSSA
jgi:hypothetical protein